MTNFRQRSLIVAMVAGLNATTCLAQSATAPTTNPPSDGQPENGDGEGLDEIVVVAQKRAEPLQTVPVAVGVVQGDSIARLNLSNFEQLSGYVPNLSVSETASGNRIAMRGISSGTNRGFEQSVGMFIDGIYAGRALQFSVPFFDVDRVEVLRGPQGVLFGKNTVAGAVSIISARPKNENSVALTASQEVRFGQTELTGIVNYQLTNNLKMRAAGRLAVARQGYLQNTILGLSEPRNNEKLGRLSASWEPGNGILVDAKYEYSSRYTRGENFQVVHAGAFAATFTRFDPQFEGNLDLQTDNYGFPSGTTTPALATNDLKSHNAAVRIEIPLGDMQIVSQSGYSAYTNHTRNSESDFTPVPLLSFNNDEKFHQFSQEVRLESGPDSKLRYVIGLYYLTNRYLGYPELLFNGSAVGFPKTRTLRTFAQDDDTYSAFGELSYPITSTLRIVGGLRWSHENKKVDRSQVVLDFNTGAPQTSAAILGFTKAALGSQNFSNSQTLKENQWTPSATVQFDAAPGIMLYGRFSKGNKAGGFDASDFLGTAPPYLAESVTGYEAGAKMRLGRSATFNLAAFTTTFSNLQVQAFNGLAFVTNNAAKARSAGVEADARWKMARGLLLSASAAYLDAHYSDYSGATCTTDQAAAFKAAGLPGSCTQNLTGRPLVYAPKWSGSFNLNYSMPVSGDWELATNVGMNIKSASYVAADLDPLSRVGGYATFDASIGLIAPSDRYSLTLLAKNIGDKRVITTLINDPLFNGAKSASISAPRTIIIKAGVKF